MKTVHEILTQVAQTSSRNEKELILRGHKDHELLKKVCFLALDPFTNFWIKKIPPYTTDSTNVSLETVVIELELFSNRHVTGNAAINHLQKMLSCMNGWDANVIERIIGKDLRCGASEGTINKVWPNLIPEYPVMLASPFDMKIIERMTWPAIAQMKLDGMRFNAIVRKSLGTVEYFARSGKRLDIQGVLDEAFLSLVKNVISDGDWVFDGELWVADSNENPLNRKTGNGILTKSIKGTISKSECAKIRGTLWDMVEYEQFLKQYDSTPYALRFNLLERVLNKAKLKSLTLVEYKQVDNLEQAQEIFQQYLDKGQEGIILKDASSPWEDKRSKLHIKFKAEKECDLEIINWHEGSGKYTNLLGALEAKTSDDKLFVKVSGFTDEQRKTLTSEKTVGKIITVRYNEKIIDKRTEKYSLFLPRVVEIREDKTSADSLEQVQ